MERELEEILDEASKAAMPMEEVKIRLQHVLRHAKMILQDSNCNLVHGDLEVMVKEVEYILANTKA